MRPIPGNVAGSWHKKLTYAYIFFAWNGLGFAYYRYQKHQEEHKDDTDVFRDKSNGEFCRYHRNAHANRFSFTAHYWARSLNLKNPVIYNLSLKGVEKTVMTEEDYPKVMDFIGNDRKATSSPKS